MDVKLQVACNGVTMHGETSGSGLSLSSSRQTQEKSDQVVLHSHDLL